MDTPVYWLPSCETGSLVLDALPSVLPAEGNLVDLLAVKDVRIADGTYFRCDIGGGRSLHLLRLAGVDADAPLAVVIPLDADGLDRIEAATRLLCFLMRRSVPPDRRLTERQRQRARQMLQAIDGRMSGASYRDIACAIYGTDRVHAEAWKTSALRDAVMGFVRDARAMIGGGYRRLLRRRRRK
ncbi:DUF2285 domain-containing protein [Paracoccus sp. APAP_BH8]|uniref:DUF2285 domain-containing protein n=1 Tax=unclassified Paracoccus (in: a-proteobacteria) TaxID=2688777 RepID=UPI0025504026|nr:DUF2285 domain-containing protein [Paracoccus sp. SSJ]MDK8873395.1 DUF2285 domain-containing protein [Paracoccus sp. SSJ]